MNTKIELLDTSLRDGQQANGISNSVSDRLRMVMLLDDLGVDIIEGGNPASNPKEREFFQKAGQLTLKHAKLAAFGATRRKELTADEDENLALLCGAGTEYVSLFGKSWLLHVREILRTTEEENLKMITDSVRYCTARGKKVIFDAEHFFDGYKDNPDYALKVLNAAHEAGARTLVLCDTNGGTLCDEIGEITEAVSRLFPGKIGVHCHNDSAMAVASTVMAVKKGAVHVQGVLLGYGERAGNAELAAVIANLQLKTGYRVISDESLKKLHFFAQQAAELNNTSLELTAPYVGRNAFAHKGGMHIDGVLKQPQAFEHVPPESVGNTRDFLLSEFSGKSAISSKLSLAYPELNEDPELVAKLTERIKELEHQGYHYEGAQASFELEVQRQIGKYKPFFGVDYYKVVSEQPDAESRISAMAMIKVDVNGQKQVTAYEGLGPVNALDGALRKALRVFYPRLRSVRLIDYKVRVLDSGTATASSVRVIIESEDENRRWATVGVSTDVIHASLTALVDSVEYKLLQDLIDGE